MSNVIAIVGRPNVGKSTFFNRLTGGRKAIVDEVAGVTRDRHYGNANWNGVDFSVIDTGGYVVGSEDVFEKHIRSQVEIALAEASVILFLVDITAGLTIHDEKVAQYLRKSQMKTKIFLVANKADTHERESGANEFYKLGMGNVYPISSVNGSGTGELLDEVVKSFTDVVEEDISGLPKFAIVGRPNAGKSSLLNALLGEERAIVTDIAGTTRDVINTHYKKFNHDFVLIDTAGIRKKRQFEDDVEFYSIMRAVRAIENCDVCLLVIDAQRGMEAQDVNIFQLAQKNKKGIVILVNKWDLVPNKAEALAAFEKNVKEKTAPFNDLPILFISALEKQRIMKAVEVAEEVYHRRKMKITDEELTEKMTPAIQKHPPYSDKGRLVDIYGMGQIPSSAPVFIIWCNYPKSIKESYTRYLENQLREQFNFCGVPVEINFREK